MADNYTQASIAIEGLSDTEVAWFRQNLATFQYEQLPDAPDDQLQRNFDVEWTDESLLLYVDEMGDLDKLVECLQKFLQATNLAGCLSLSWAFTCSKMRPGEFGGGAAFITAENVTYCDTFQFLQEQEAKFNARGTT